MTFALWFHAGSRVARHRSHGRVPKLPAGGSCLVFFILRPTFRYFHLTYVTNIIFARIMHIKPFSFRVSTPTASFTGFLLGGGRGATEVSRVESGTKEKAGKVPTCPPAPPPVTLSHSPFPHIPGVFFSNRQPPKQHIVGKVADLVDNIRTNLVLTSQGVGKDDVTAEGRPDRIRFFPDNVF